MRVPFPLRLQRRRGLLIYQLVLILIGIVILILVLLYIARRHQIGAASEAAARAPAAELIVNEASLAGTPRTRQPFADQAETSSPG
ncbi:MAG TPA: hypothetical protein VFK04_01905 [Gemmatimonadaceae bacterium]|nr:hypothetical protein [Gemmatimonadaceae bacterium]